MEVSAPLPVGEIPKIPHKRWMAIARDQDAALLRLLGALDDAEWTAPTECEPWSVKDMMAHTLGWAEALSNPRVYARQSYNGFRTKKSFDGSQLDAVNDYQVRTRIDLTPAEIVARLERSLRRQNKVVSGVGMSIGFVPFREPFSGSWVNLAYLGQRIFTRDHFMHRLDIWRATGRAPDAAETDPLIVADVVQEWARRSKASVDVYLSGPAGGAFRCGNGTSGTIKADAYDLMRRLAGRAGDVEAEGDERAIGSWLGVLCAF